MKVTAGQGKDISMENFNKVKAMVNSMKWEVVVSKAEFKSAKGQLSSLEQLTKDLREKEVSLGKIKKNLMGVITNCDAQDMNMVSSFYKSRLVEAKEKKKAIIKVSQRLESILENSEDIDGKPLTYSLVQASYMTIYIYVHIYIYICIHIYS